MNADFNINTSTNPNYSNDKKTTLIIKDTNMIIPINATGTNAEDIDEQVFGSLLDDEVERVFTAETEILKNEFMSMILPKKGSLSAILRSYKSAVSRDYHKIYRKFDWHTRFHDRIIRNSTELLRIQSYIRKNPQKCSNDRFYNKLV